MRVSKTYERFQPEKILKNILGNNGYFAVNLYLNGKIKTFIVHQLVAIAFLNHTPNGYKLVVDHIDNDPLNNNLDNLQIITQRDNTSKDKKGGSSKFTGVFIHKQTGKWRALININDKLTHLGLFNCELAASQAYQKALKQL